MKKGVKSIRQKEQKKDNLEKFPTFFFLKKNTTGTLLSMLVMKWLCLLSAKEYTPGFEMCTMEGKLCLPSRWHPTFTAPIAANYIDCGTYLLPPLPDTQLLGGTIPHTWPTLISEPDIWVAESDGHERCPSTLIPPSPVYILVNHQKAKSTDSVLVVSQKYFYPVKVNMCSVLKEAVGWYSWICS